MYACNYSKVAGEAGQRQHATAAFTTGIGHEHHVTYVTNLSKQAFLLCFKSQLTA